MKNTTMTLLTALAVTASVQAGESYSAKGKEVIPPPAPSCLWTWFAGGSVSYVDGDWGSQDWEEPMYTLHVGVERKCPGQSCSHAFYLEVGYTELDESWNVPYTSGASVYGDFSKSAEVIPITLNYKYECQLTDKLNWYVGAGAGIALVDAETTQPSNTAGIIGADKWSDDDTALYAHIFAGLVYNICDSFEVFGGARYIYMDDVFDSADGPLDGAMQYELGGRINF